MHSSISSPITCSIHSINSFYKSLVSSFMDRFQDLPHDIALQCFIRVPFNQFHTIRSVCKAWKAEVHLPELLRLRNSTGKAQSHVVLSQAKINPAGKRKCLDVPVYRLVVFEPETGSWSEMPCLPEFENGLPLFCGMVAVGSDLVVMGGYGPGTWDCLNSVFIFDFLSSKWRRGADMPGGPRSFFGCAADGQRTVFVAGGHDLEKNALKSVWTYDVAKDNWTQLPDMTKERDECECLFYRGKFHVINGYPTNMQGQFHQSIEVFDMLARKWSESNGVLSESTDTPEICVKGTDKKLYTSRANDVAVLEDDTWQSVTRLPAEVTNMQCLVSFLGHLLLIGTPKYGEPSNAYKMDLNKRVWTKVHVPVEYSGHIESGCCLII
ncbi:putative F-box domain, kelch-type beta propeller, F-box-like domain superfamily [Helianthus annuus]|nr:putative F-box/kelch-repeat protein KMD1/2 [Helianthus annuus]KAJ0643388.1 putative F-box/kelch-repeat protein KMD1/2 [Helianthus annuus]KAJ0834017.1 putative F-box domain, kelch-type beta propeller, F-box-like domain superfamily [Helianthus annuus]